GRPTRRARAAPGGRPRGGGAPTAPALRLPPPASGIPPAAPAAPPRRHRGRLGSVRGPPTSRPPCGGCRPAPGPAPGAAPPPPGAGRAPVPAPYLPPGRPLARGPHPPRRAAVATPTARSPGPVPPGGTRGGARAPRGADARDRLPEPRAQ